MEKIVRTKAGAYKDAALVSIGWVAFLIGLLGKSQFPMVAVCLLMIARVLPLALQQNDFEKLSL